MKEGQKSLGKLYKFPDLKNRDVFEILDGIADIIVEVEMLLQRLNAVTNLKRDKDG